MNKAVLVTIVFLCTLLNVSCDSSKNLSGMVYLADSIKQSQTVIQNFDYKLQSGDRIDIVVTALNPLAAQAFNITATPVSSISNGMPGMTGNSGATGGGYLVGSDGNIQFPQLGSIHVEGMTTKAVEAEIQNKLLQYIKEPVVIVNITNFKVNVLGEVNRPGAILVPDGKITILQAISQSGDLTIFGKRESILIVREKSGKRKFGKVDLTSKSIFESPYYYLEQGDVVYVAMNKNKLLLNDASESRNFRIASLVLAGITAAAIIINALK